jgi:hypothetical protein
MEKILTAEEFIQDYWDVDCDFMESMTEQLDNCSGFGFDNIPDLMEKFANYQAERMYSEEEVLNFTQIILSQYIIGNTNIEQLDLLKETLHIFKYENLELL